MVLMGPKIYLKFPLASEDQATIKEIFPANHIAASLVMGQTCDGN